MSPTLNGFDSTDTHAVTLVTESFADSVTSLTNLASGGPDDNDAQGGHLVEVTTLHRDMAATLNSGGNNGGFRTEPGEHQVFTGLQENDDPLLPAGLSSNRYRCIGNGVASPVAQWIGHRLALHFSEVDE